MNAELTIHFLVPLGVDPLDYRNRAEARAAELGWPEPHSAGTSFAHDNHVVADLAWTLDDDAYPDDVIAMLSREFYVRKVDFT
jgi:hypothetical protein